MKSDEDNDAIRLPIVVNVAGGRIPPQYLTCGNRRSRGAVGPPTKLLGKQLVHPAPLFFCNLQLKVTLQVTFDTKIVENSPAASGVLPQTPFGPIVHCVYTFFRKTYILLIVILWIQSINQSITCRLLQHTDNLIVLIVFHQFLLPQPKNRSLAYGSINVLGPPK